MADKIRSLPASSYRSRKPFERSVGRREPARRLEEGNNVAKSCRATSRDTRINYPARVNRVHGLLAAGILLINGHGTNFRRCGPRTADRTFRVTFYEHDLLPARLLRERIIPSAMVMVSSARPGRRAPCGTPDKERHLPDVLIMRLERNLLRVTLELARVQRGPPNCPGYINAATAASDQAPLSTLRYVNARFYCRTIFNSTL